MSQNPFGDSELKFPLICTYKVIAEDHEGMQVNLEKALREIGILNPPITGNHSKQGRYITFNVEITVNSLEYMNRVDAALRAVPGVRMVL